MFYFAISKERSDAGNIIRNFRESLPGTAPGDYMDGRIYERRKGMYTLEDLLQSLKRLGVSPSDVHIMSRKNPDDIDEHDDGADESQVEED